MPDDLQSITPALSNFLNALTITDLVIPTLSAILLATRVPSFPLSSLKIFLIASSSDVDNVSIADLTIFFYLTSSAFSSEKESVLIADFTI